MDQGRYELIIILIHIMYVQQCMFISDKRILHVNKDAYKSKFNEFNLTWIKSKFNCTWIRMLYKSKFILLLFAKRTKLKFKLLILIAKYTAANS